MAAPLGTKPVSESPLRLARVAFTGRLASMTRRRAAVLVEAAGGTAVSTVSRRTSLLVVGMDGWPLLPDGTISRKLRRAEELNRRDGRIRIVSEETFLELAGARSAAPALRKSYSEQRVCALLDLPPETLRRYEALGLIRSADGLYDFQDIVSLRTVVELVSSGVAPATISRSIRGLASVLPETDRPLSQLKIVVEHRGGLLAELGDRLIAPDGQMLLSWDRRTAAAPPPAGAAPAAGPPAAEALLERGLDLEDDERLAEAAEAYRSALAQRPGWAEAHFNLGNALRGLGRLEAAEERYRAALEHAPGLAEAWYNLADLLDETGRLEPATQCLRRALEAAPGYADAHFNLASCWQRLGRREEAARHWRAYLALDSDSEWADVARRHLNRRRAGGP